MLTRKDLISGLRGFRAMIVEANEWRPMADYILELARQGFFKNTQEDPNEGLELLPSPKTPRALLTPDEKDPWVA